MVQVCRRLRLVQPPKYNDVDERRCEVQGLDSNMSSHLLEIGGGLVSLYPVITAITAVILVILVFGVRYGQNHGKVVVSRTTT